VTRSARHRIVDIIESIDFVQTTTKGKGFGDFVANIQLRYAVQMAMVIIAEAANNIPKEVLAAYPSMSWSDMIGMGVRIKHHYYRIDPRIAWDAITRDFPELLAVAKRMLADLDQPALPL